MESFFDVKLAKTLASENSGSNGDYFCSISTCNIVAFTSTTNLLVASTDSISNNFGFYVFICDIK